MSLPEHSLRSQSVKYHINYKDFFSAHKQTHLYHRAAKVITVFLQKDLFAAPKEKILKHLSSLLDLDLHSDQTRCLVCKTPTSSICSLCKRVYYCKVECQKQDFDFHRPLCTKTLRDFSYVNPLSIDQFDIFVKLAFFLVPLEESEKPESCNKLLRILGALFPNVVAQALVTLAMKIKIKDHTSLFFDQFPLFQENENSNKNLENSKREPQPLVSLFETICQTLAVDFNYFATESEKEPTTKLSKQEADSPTSPQVKDTIIEKSYDIENFIRPIRQLGETKLLNAIQILCLPFLRRAILFLIYFFGPNSLISQSFHSNFQAVDLDPALEFSNLAKLSGITFFEFQKTAQLELSIQKLLRSRSEFCTFSPLEIPLPFQFAIHFPETFEELLFLTNDQKCSYCHTHPRMPAICMMCSQMVCISHSCCKKEKQTESVWV